MNLALSVWLASWYGLTGIIWATVIADLINKGVLMGYLYYRRRIVPKRYIDLKLFLAYSLVLLLTYFAVT